MRNKVIILVISLLLVLQSGCISESSSRSGTSVNKESGNEVNTEDKIISETKALTETVEVKAVEINAEEINRNGSPPIIVDIDESVLPSIDSKPKLDDLLMIDTGLATGYVKLDDFNADKINEIGIDYDFKDGRNILVAESDDFILLGFITTETLVYSSSYDCRKDIIKIVKLDRKGELMWEKKHYYLNETGNLSNLLLTSDGGYILTICQYNNPEFTQSNGKGCLIVKCDKYGNEVWKTPINDTYGDILKKIYINNKNELYALGTGYIDKSNANKNNQAKNEEYPNIIITKLNSEGKIIKQEGFGGSDFDELYDSKYVSGTGFIIQGRTQSTDGDFSSSSQKSCSFIACIDENLELNWAHSFSEKEIITSNISLGNGQIFVHGYSINGFKKSSIPILFSFNLKGKLLWEKRDFNPFIFIEAVSVLKSGRIIASTKGSLILMDSYGNIINERRELMFTASEFLPTSDGGFIAKAYRQVKTIPQPAYISSIWYDTETFLAKYDEQLNLIWNKSYNKYEDSLSIDFTYILNDEAVLVEK